MSATVAEQGSAPAAPDRVGWRDSWPFVAMMAGAVLWWVLGVQLFIYTLFAVPMLMWLLRRRSSIEIPPGFLVFLTFVLWATLSALSLTSGRYAMAFLMRYTLEITAFVVGVWVWTMLRRGLSPRVLVWSVVAFWIPVIVLAVPGLFGQLEFATPFELLLRAAGVNQPFLHASAHAQFAEYDTLYNTPRPSALFPYTNQWGSGVGLMTPFAIYAMVTTRRRWVRLSMGFLLAVAVVVVVMSVNRGSWISLIVIIGYVTLRQAIAGNFRTVARVGVAVIVAAVGVVVSPLMTLIRDRLDTPNVSTRETLYHAALQLTKQSPFIGYGAPQSSAGLADSNDVSIGTHGQIWTLLVSHGFVGAALFVLMLVVVLFRCRPNNGDSPEIWLHSVGLVAIVQLGFYDVLPLGMILAFVGAFICATEVGRFTSPVRVPGESSEGNPHVLVDA